MLEVTRWPNWVDLVVLIIVTRACYSGFFRSLVWALVMLASAVSLTALVINYASLITLWVAPWIGGSPVVAQLLVFWLIFLIAHLIAHITINRIFAALKWTQPANVFLQGLGAIAGILRGVWWAAFMMIVLQSSGFVYMRQSVEDESVLGYRLLGQAYALVEGVADSFPGAQYRSEDPVPPTKSRRDPRTSRAGRNARDFDRQNCFAILPE